MRCGHSSDRSESLAQISFDLPEVTKEVRPDLIAEQENQSKTIRKRGAVLSSLQRTLSPRRHSARPSLASIGSFYASSRDKGETLDLSVASARLVELSKHKLVRTHPEWLNFFATNGDDDLHSFHVEKKRLKRTTSDQSLPDHSDGNTLDPLPSLTALSQHQSNGSNGSRGETAGSGSSMLAAVVSAGLVDSPFISQMTGAGRSIEMRRDASDATAMTSSTSDMSILPLSTPRLRSPPIDGPDVFSPSPSTDSLTTTQAEAHDHIVTLDSFDIIRVLGKGCAGKVLLVRKKDDARLLALKVITKQHVGTTNLANNSLSVC